MCILINSCCSHGAVMYIDHMVLYALVTLLLLVCGSRELNKADFFGVKVDKMAIKNYVQMCDFASGTRVCLAYRLVEEQKSLF